MKIESKDLAFIDRIAESMLSSKLSHTSLILSKEQIHSLATSAYQMATVVHEAREAFKKENNLEDLEPKVSSPIFEMQKAPEQSCQCKTVAQEIHKPSVVDIFEDLEADGKEDKKENIPAVAKRRGRPPKAVLKTHKLTHRA